MPPEIPRLLAWSAAGSALTLGLIVLALRNPRLRDAMADHPNERSLHRTVTPRIGGLAILVGGLAVALAAGDFERWPIFYVGYAALALLSAVDDRLGLSATLRLAAHLSIASLFLWQSGVDPRWLVPLVLAVSWSINLFNFMDGADGLAGGMAAIGLGTFGILAGTSGGPGASVVAQTSFVLAGCCLGFLVCNFPPARVFLGDAGSIPLGFAAAAIGVQGAGAGLWSPLIPPIVFFPFVFDATLTLSRRLLAGHPPWRAHREHLYQRSVMSGMTHRQMTLRAYGLMGACAVLATAAQGLSIWVQASIIAMQAAVGSILARRILRRLPPQGQPV